MKPPPRISPALLASAVPKVRLSISLPVRTASCSHRIHTDGAKPANVVPVYGTGPPPEPPVPSPSHYETRLARRRKQAALLRQAQELRAAARAKNGTGAGKSSAAAVGLKRRFWKDVHVREVDGAYEIHLDARPLRRPNTKEVIRLPLSKPHLAHALALEWDLITSAQQATKQHLVPLTSLICRALDIADDDAAHYAQQDQQQQQQTQPSSSSTTAGFAPTRAAIATMLLRYLDTDSLLCWAPPPPPDEVTSSSPPLSSSSTTTNTNAATSTPTSDSTTTTPTPPTAAQQQPPSSLRHLQEQTAAPILAFLTTRVWPGITIEPVLDDAGSIVPRGQRPGVREVVQGWLLGLPHWELAGLERAALAGKGLLGAVRLVVEWSEGRVGVGGGASHDVSAREQKRGDEVKLEHDHVGESTATGDERFGVEEAAQAASLEVDWQTRRWGEVEDTHDVDKEDLRRQLGSVVLLVSGTGRQTHGKS